MTYRVDSIEEFFDIARSSVIGTLPANDRAAMVTVRAGVGVLMANDANGRGLSVPPMPEAAQRRMLELFPFAAACNPIEVTRQFVNDPSLLDQTGLRSQPPADLDALAAALSRLSLFAAANTAAIGSLDLNPFLVRPEGEGALALDAVLVTAPSPGTLGSAAAQGQGRD